MQGFAHSETLQQAKDAHKIVKGQLPVSSDESDVINSVHWDSDTANDYSLRKLVVPEIGGVLSIPIIII